MKTVGPTIQIPKRAAGILIGVLFLSIAVYSAAAQLLAPGTKVKEIIIKVEGNIIALPGRDSIARVPLSAARVRSTPLREVNTKYHATMVERLYEISRVSRDSAASGHALVSRERVTEDEGKVDLSRIFTKEMKKKLEKEGKKIASVPDTYLLELHFQEEPDMKEVVRDYESVEVVEYAQEIVRAKEDDKE